MKSELEIFAEFLTHKGMRLTAEREAVLSEVFAEHDHFDIDELFLRLRQKGQRISRASVYRTLPLLVGSGLVNEVYFEDGHLHYEHIYGHDHHCHLRCLGCRKIFEFKDEGVLKAERRIARANGFEATWHKMEIFGYCSQCRGKKK